MTQNQRLGKLALIFKILSLLQSHFECLADSREGKWEIKPMLIKIGYCVPLELINSYSWHLKRNLQNKIILSTGATSLSSNW